HPHDTKQITAACPGSRHHPEPQRPRHQGFQPLVLIEVHVAFRVVLPDVKRIRDRYIVRKAVLLKHNKYTIMKAPGGRATKEAQQTHAQACSLFLRTLLHVSPGQQDTK
ncbi:hypothetical protein E4U54_002704, partial [Claviceps lovelessii]